MGRPKGSKDTIQRKSKSFWSTSEIQVLRDNLDKPYEWLINRLNKSQAAIQAQLRALRLMKPNIFAYIDYIYLETDKYAISGVYGIRNKQSGRIYIGSADNIKTRLITHLRELESGKHDNQELQADWNKDEFEFLLLYVCHSNQTLKFEERIMASWPNTYNQTLITKKYWLSPKKKQWVLSRIKNGLPDECWEWQGKKNKDGYGVFVFDKKEFLAHRAALYINGQNIEGSIVCHKCHNKLCCNPSHLECGTSKTNAIQTGQRRREFLKTEIEKLWQSGMGLWQICQTLHCAYSTAKEILEKDLGIAHKRRKRI